MKKIAIYSRKSKETDTGESIKNQINLCKDYFLKQKIDSNFEIFIDEGFSGGNTNRPAFKRMLQLAKHKEFDVIAVYKIDRIARNITDFFNIYSDLEKNDVTLISITEGFDATTPIGRMMMTMLAGFADMERENIRQRVSDNMSELAKLGRWNGGTTPTGYNSVTKLIDGKKATFLELDTTYIYKINSLFKLASEGFTTYQIGQQLNMNPKTILNIIQNPTYLKSDIISKNYLEKIGYKVFGEINGKGFLSYGRRPVKNGKKLFNAKGMLVAVSDHEGIVDSSTWISANEQISSRGECARPRISNYSFLAHLVKCSCGSGMFISCGKIRKDGSKPFYFRCSARKNNISNCNYNKSLRVDLAEKAFLEEMNKLALNKNLIKQYVTLNNKVHDYKSELDHLKNHLKNNNKIIDELTEKLLLLNGNALKIINDKINKISQENIELNSKIFLIERNLILENDNTLSIDKLQKLIRLLLENFNDISLTEKQIAVQKIIKQIIFDGDNSIKIIFNDVILNG